MKTIKSCYISLLICVLCLFSLGATVMFSNAVAAGGEKVYLSVNVFDYDADYLPSGVEGKTYPVFDYEALDENGNVVQDVDVLVSAPDGKLLTINESRFKTETVGRYVITYKATKGASEAIVDLFVDVIEADEYVKPSYQINSDIVSSIYTGNRILLPDGQLSGGMGDVCVERTIEYLGEYSCGSIEVFNFGYGPYFIPEVSGTYTVKYTMSDIVGTTTEDSKSITVTDSEVPLLKKPAISLSGKVGETFTFERTEAVVYVNGKKVYIPVKTYADGTDITDTMTFVPTEAGSFVIKYEVVNPFNPSEENTVVYEQTVSVNDAALNKTNKAPYISNYLSLDGFSGAWIAEPESQEDKLQGIEYDVYTLTADGNSDTASMQFKYALPVQYANMKIGFNTANADFEEIYLYFTDSIDGEKVIEILLKENKMQKTEVYVNGVYETTLSKTLSNESAFTTELTYCFEIDRTSGVLKETSGNTEITTITAYKNGDEFNFFASGKIYLSAEMKGISGKSDLKLYEIATQTISSYSTDRGKPLFVTPINFTGVFNTEKNKIFIVEQLTAFDLFDDDVNIKINVVAPDKSTVYTGPLTENYSFTPTMYGQYNVYYIAYDSSNCTRETKCVVNVIDRIAPTISTVSIPEKVKVGETITFTAAEITDNHSEYVATWIYVTYGNFQRITLDKDNKFTFKNAGTYVVKYGAEDDAGNFTVVAYTIVCE